MKYLAVFSSAVLGTSTYRCQAVGHTDQKAGNEEIERIFSEYGKDKSEFVCHKGATVQAGTLDARVPTAIIIQSCG